MKRLSSNLVRLIYLVAKRSRQVNFPPRVEVGFCLTLEWSLEQRGQGHYVLWTNRQITLWKKYEIMIFRLTFNNPGALVISLCSLHHWCVIGGETRSTGFSKGNSGDNETIIAIRLSPASNWTWYSTSSRSSSTLNQSEGLIFEEIVSRKNCW